MKKVKTILNFIFISIFVFNFVFIPVKALEQNSLYNEIGKNAVLDNKKSTHVNSASGIDFSQSSSTTNGQGTYIVSDTENDKYPIYYYRGNVNDNNIIFANFCWKIVRTTETGGVKLLYNGKPTDGKCNNTKTATEVGKSKFNDHLNSVAYNGYMYGEVYEVNSADGFASSWVHWGKDVEYKDGQYTVLDRYFDAKYGWSYSWDYLFSSSPKNVVIDGKRYSCMRQNTNYRPIEKEDYICSEVKYIFYTNKDGTFFITLKDGKKVSDALSEMRENKNDSTIKQKIDNWYEENLINYTNQIEDTVWYNDRQLLEDNGWFLSGRTDVFSFYKSASNNTNESFHPNLKTNNESDQFTVNKENGNGNLKYPIGLLTVDEASYAGSLFNSTNKNYLASGETYWTMSPYVYKDYFAFNFRINETGNTNDWYVDNEQGVRPAISLMNNMVVVSGDGTSNNPYQVKQKHKVTIKTEESLQKYFAEIEETTYLEGDEVTLNNLKNGQIIDGYKFIGYETSDVTIDGNKKFIMPDKDVTIIAKFEKEKETIKDKIQGAIKNPNTASFIGVVCALYIISSVSYVILKHNKVKRY